MTCKDTEEALHTHPGVVCQIPGGPQTHTHKPNVQRSVRGAVIEVCSECWGQGRILQLML